MSSLDEIYNKLIQIQDELATAVASAKLNPKQIVIVNGLSDINNSLGSVRAGEFLALSSGQDPQDDDGTGTFISATGRVFGVDKYHIGGVKDGDLKWGANSETGDLEAGDGAVTINDDGIEIVQGTGGSVMGSLDPNAITFTKADGTPVAYVKTYQVNTAYPRIISMSTQTQSNDSHLGSAALYVSDPDGSLRSRLSVNGLSQYVEVETGLDLDETYSLIGGYQSIADDEVYSFTPNEKKGAILIYDYKDDTVGGIIIYNIGTVSCTTSAMLARSNTNVTTGELTGTTGTDGKFTVSAHTDGKIYFENRRGGGLVPQWNNFSGN